jgi:hypothetical protein
MEPVNTEVREDDFYEPVRIAASLGVSYRRIDYYLRRGFIVCENPTPGSGNGPRKLSRREVEILALMCKFIEIGFLPEPAALLARRMVFEQSHTTTLPGGIIITLTEESDSGSQKDDDLDCSTEAQDL